MKQIARLTDLEIKIMKVLWDHDQNLTIQQIAKCLKADKISTGSVTQVMSHLITKQAVEVCDYVLVSSVYARAFRPSFNQEEFLAAEFKRMQEYVLGSKKNSFGLAAAIISDSVEETVSEEEVIQLQAFVNEKLRKLRNKEK